MWNALRWILTAPSLFFAGLFSFCLAFLLVVPIPEKKKKIWVPNWFKMYQQFGCGKTQTIYASECAHLHTTRVKSYFGSESKPFHTRHSWIQSYENEKSSVKCYLLMESFVFIGYRQCVSLTGIEFPLVCLESVALRVHVVLFSV